MMISRARRIVAIAGILIAAILSMTAPLTWAAPRPVLPLPVSASAYCDSTVRPSVAVAAVVRHGNRTAVYMGRQLSALKANPAQRSSPDITWCRALPPVRVTPSR